MHGKFASLLGYLLAVAGQPGHHRPTRCPKRYEKTRPEALCVYVE